MKIIRKAQAIWNGTGKEGAGKVSTQSGTLKDTQVSYKSRFEEGTGTNPEELIGAAHASCFSMKLAFLLQEKDVTAESIDTTSKVILEDEGITKVELVTQVKANGLSDSDFQALAADAKENCPVSKLFKSDITLEAHLTKA